MEDFRGQLSQAMQDSVAQVESISDGILENLDLLSSSAAAFYSAHRDELVLFGVLRANDVLGMERTLPVARYCHTCKCPSTDHRLRRYGRQHHRRHRTLRLE